MRTWGEAMQAALYGPQGYYLRANRGPGHDYRTSSTASPIFAAAVLRLVAHVDESLDYPEVLDVVEVAAANGRLLRQLAALAPVHHPDLATRMRLHGVDLAPRPEDLDTSIAWSAEIPETHGLLLANEWLDNVALDVVEITDAGPRLVLVDSDGAESLGPVPSPNQIHWLDTWWPTAHAAVGDRAEIGLPRDLAWAHAFGKLRKGVAVTADYSTLRSDRADGSYAGGTLVGYRDGRVTTPRPDGSSDITAHVALDSVAASAAADETAIATQRDVLRALGVTGARPDVALAGSDPGGYLRALQTCSEEAELIATAGLGSHLWLAQTKYCRLPAVFRGPE